MIAGASAALLSSRANNFSNTVIESISLVTLVIGTDNSSIDEVVVPGKNGIVMENRNGDEHSVAIFEVWNGEHTSDQREMAESLRRFGAEKSRRDFISLGSF